jgi:protein-S-isoprenylcysteine O-methyltransferase Ste14
MIVAEVQIARKFVLAVVVMLGVVMFALTDGSRPNGTLAHEMIQWWGIIAIIVCIIGRTWTSFYIGGRKYMSLITEGPYSVVRNPLYLFSIIGAWGAGVQVGSIISGLIIGLLTWMVFYFQVLREERDLTARYDAEYAAYKASVPRFVPNPRLWRDLPILLVKPTKVLVTFADSLFLLLSIPLAESFEALRSVGFLPVLFQLP